MKTILIIAIMLLGVIVFWSDIIIFFTSTKCNCDYPLHRYDGVGYCGNCGKNI